MDISEAWNKLKTQKSLHCTNATDIMCMIL